MSCINIDNDDNRLTFHSSPYFILNLIFLKLFFDRRNITVRARSRFIGLSLKRAIISHVTITYISKTNSRWISIEMKQQVLLNKMFNWKTCGFLKYHKLSYVALLHDYLNHLHKSEIISKIYFISQQNIHFNNERNDLRDEWEQTKRQDIEEKTNLFWSRLYCICIIII